MSNWTNILGTLVEIDGLTNLSGDPHAVAILHATFAAWASKVPEPSVDNLESKIGQKVTLVRSATTGFGAPVIAAIEGTLFAGVLGVAIMPKGSRTKGQGLVGLVERGALLDVIDGYSIAKAKELVASIVAGLPTLVPLTQERLNALPNPSLNDSEHTPDCTLAVFGSYPFVTGTIPGTLWLVHSYEPDDDIVEGVCYIDPAEGTSEYGSCYGADMLRWQAGEVVGFEPITFAEALRRDEVATPLDALVGAPA